MANPSHQYSQNTVRDNARVQYGDTYTYNSSYPKGQEEAERNWENVLDWLSQISTWDRYHELLDHHQEGTSGWIFEDQRFSSWISSPRSSLLWLNGKMGSGKSILTAVVLRRTCTDEVDRNMFFFCDRTTRSSQLENSPNIYRAMIRQVLQVWPKEQTQSLYKKLLERYRRKDQVLTASDCRELLITIIRGVCFHRRVIFIFDALDECGPELQRDLMLKFIAPLLVGTTLKVFLSSRSELDIKPFLQGLSPSPEILSINRNNVDDIRNFVSAEVRTLNLGAATEDVERMLIERSDGMFRWVQLSIRFLQARRSAKENLRLLEDLKSLPPGLPELYDKVYAQISSLSEHDQDLSHRAFAYCMSRAWIYPLSSTEFVEAVYDERMLEDPQSAVSEVLRLSFNFLEHDKTSDRIRLAHLSVREFLEKKIALLDLGSHRSIVKLCIKQARDFLEDLNGRAWDLGRFICYAIVFWPFHLRSMSWVDTRSREEIDYWDGEPLELSHEYSHFKPIDLLSPLEGSLVGLLFGQLHYSETSWNSWEAWIQKLLITKIGEAQRPTENLNWQVFETYERYALVLKEAQRIGQIYYFRMSPDVYIKTLPDVTQLNIPNPLLVYASLGVKEITRTSKPTSDHACLLKNIVGKSPLDYLKGNGLRGRRLYDAVFGGVKQFLQTEHYLRNTLLYWAFKARDQSFFRLLVENGHAVDDIDNGGRTIVHYLAEVNFCNLLKFVCSRGVAVDQEDKRGRTPLFVAIQESTFAAADSLLEHGADINHTDTYGRTCLHWAVHNIPARGRPIKGRSVHNHPARGRPIKGRRFEWLVARGANVNTTDCCGQNPLMKLFDYNIDSIEDIADLKSSATRLIQKGMDLHHVSEDGLTARGILVELMHNWTLWESNLKAVGTLNQWFWHEIKKQVILQIITMGTVPIRRPDTRRQAAKYLASIAKSHRV